MKQYLLPAGFAIAAGLGVCSCDSRKETADARLPVAATTTMIAEMVRDIGGGHVRVAVLIPAGADPHTCEASKNEATELADAKLAFSNGLQLEEGLSAIMEDYRHKGGTVLELASAINKANCKKLADGRNDPHIWGDPRIWALCANVVVNGLGKADPANAADYAKRAAEFKARCMATFEWCQQRVERIPPRDRTLVTGHDAFHYFADAFGFKVVAGSGAGEFVKANGVKAVFAERTPSPAAAELPGEVQGVKIGGDLLSDSLGAPGELKDVGGENVDLGTYTGMLKGNVHTIVEALK
jgi:manganese/zinc/iron transport system substrate-binding protein